MKAKKIPYFVYLLRCKDESIYTGITNELQQRLAKHKAGKGAHYTRAHGAVKIIYSEQHVNRSAALKREAEIKKWPRERKIALIKKPGQ